MAEIRLSAPGTGKGRTFNNSPSPLQWNLFPVKDTVNELYGDSRTYTGSASATRYFNGSEDKAAPSFQEWVPPVRKQEACKRIPTDPDVYPWTQKSMMPPSTVINEKFFNGISPVVIRESGVGAYL